MNLEGLIFPGLECITVHLTGAWDAGSRKWYGAVTAAVPLVGMAFIHSSGYCEWCKSERNESSPEVRLALFPFDDVGLDVQVNFSVGHGGRRWSSVLPSAA